MTLEDKLQQSPKVLSPEDLQQLNLLRYKAKFLDSQLAHVQRDLKEIHNALEDSLLNLKRKAESVGATLGVEIADWNENSGIILEQGSAS